MVHAANRRIAQNLDSADSLEFRWTKNIVDAAIVDCRITGRASKIAKVAQDKTVRFTVVFQIVSIKIRLVGGFEFKVEIAGDENGRRLRSSLRPIDQCFGVSSAVSSVEGISVGAQKEYLRSVLAWL